MQERQRIESIDALRGLAVLLMVAHHFLFDLVCFLGIPQVWFSNPVFDVLHYFFAGVFILLSGVCSRFSRSNVKRGIRAMLLAFGITLVTTAVGEPVRFGVLHMLGFCMVFYGLTEKIWNAIPRQIAPILYGAGVLCTAFLADGQPSEYSFLWMFGWVPRGFQSSDYFPILPWIFVFLLGTWLGQAVKEEKLPRWVYTAKAPHLAAVGRKSLWIYLLHQPILYGLTLLLKAVLGK